MKTLSESEYESLIEGGEVVESDATGAQVTFLRDGSVLKFFSRKPFLSSATLRPYAVRFAQNVEKLHARNVWTVRTLDLYSIAHMNAIAVHYEPIPGDTLRSLARASDDPAPLLSDFAGFAAALHDQGIFFRSLHLANVIVGEDGKMGLIDVADLWMKRRPLSFKERFRNFGKIYRYAKDIQLIRKPGPSFLIDAYLSATTASGAENWRVPLQAQQDEYAKNQKR